MFSDVVVPTSLTPGRFIGLALFIAFVVVYCVYVVKVARALIRAIREYLDRNRPWNVGMRHSLRQFHTDQRNTNISPAATATIIIAMVQPAAAMCSASVQLVSSTTLTAEYAAVSESCNFATYTLDWQNKSSSYTYSVTDDHLSESYSDVWLVCVASAQRGLNSTVCHKFPLQDCNYYSDHMYYYYCVADNGPSLVDAIILSLLIWSVYSGYGYVLKTIMVILSIVSTIFQGKVYTALLTYLKDGFSVVVQNKDKTPTYLMVSSGDRMKQDAALSAQNNDVDLNRPHI
jgi:hypothetical protein